MVRKKTGPTDGEANDPEILPDAQPEASPGPENSPFDPAPRDLSEAGELPGEIPSGTPEPEAVEPAGSGSEYNVFTEAEAQAVPAEVAPRPMDAPMDPEDAALLRSVDDAVDRGDGEPRDSETREEDTLAAAEPERAPEPEPELEPVAEPVPEDHRRDEAPRDDHAHDEHTEEHAEEGSSFAARVLTGLLLLLVGAGVGIWAAPKVAPALPAGMKPVADWLMPGQTEAEARIAELRGELGTVQSQLGTVSAGIDGKIGDVESRIDSAVGDLRNQISQADDTDLSQRLDRLEASLAGQTTELTTLKSQITGGEGSGAGVDVYRAELDGMRTEIGTLSDKVGGLATQVADVATKSDRQIETTQATVEQVQTEAAATVDAATSQAALAQIRAAMAAGGVPFAAPLATLAETPDLTLPEGLSAAGESGVASMATLRDSFPDAAHAAIRAAIMGGAENGGILDRSRAFLEAQVATRSLAPRDGVGPDAVLSRMEDKLRHDDLAGAIAESDNLPSEAAQAMSGWLDAAKLRANAETGFGALTADLSAKN